MFHAHVYIGASNATVIAVLSILVPIAFGIILWNEQPNSYQVAGIGLALVSLTLIGGTTMRRAAEPPHSFQSSWLRHLILRRSQLGIAVACTALILLNYIPHPT